MRMATVRNIALFLGPPMFMASGSVLGTVFRRTLSRLTVAGAVLFLFGASASYAAAASQLTFATPDQAFSAFVQAAQRQSTSSLLRMLGPEGRSLLTSGDSVADRQALTSFVALYAEANRIAMHGADHATLVMGKDEWPFPIPLVNAGGRWRFDTAAGKEEILDRRIGLNELSVIEACQAFVDAQREYASKDRNHDGFDEYAQKFASSPGKRDGLYWPTDAGEEDSPLGPLFAEAQAAGYFGEGSAGVRAPYYGYYYMMLKGQGKDAPGGAYDYVVNGHMIGGFALVAFPAQFKVSGVMTFIVNHDGVVYQKDLGPNGVKIASQMTLFNPDATWMKQ
jgi:hypothetical protein